MIEYTAPTPAPPIEGRGVATAVSNPHGTLPFERSYSFIITRIVPSYFLIIT